MVELTDKAERAAEEIYGPISVEWHAALGRYTVGELAVMLDLLDRGTEIATRIARRLGSSA